MPELKQPPQYPDVDLERLNFLFAGEQSPDDSAAAKLVTTTFGKYESQRTTVERRWSIAANLYHGVIDRRNWPGTDIERAALPVPIVYDQIESAYPLVIEALFAYWPTFFEVSPIRDTTPQEAALAREELAAQLDTPFDDSGITPSVHMGMAIKQAEKLGDGALEISWDAEKKRVVVEWVDVRDLYLDMSAHGPAADWSPALIHRALMTVEDLAALRGTEGVNIPPDNILNYFAKSRYISSGDIERQREASARKEQYFIGDLRTDPRHQLVEVLKYVTKDRIIWVIGRMWTAINAENPYGFINYVRAPWTLVEGRPYSMGLPEVLEGDQKYAQGIRNARLDNLALMLHPPRKRAAGTPTSPGKEKWGPGHVDQVADVSQADQYTIENATGDAHQEEAVIHQGAAKRTGVNEMVQSGIPTPSNANRSATGVAAQQKSVGTRLSTHVKNIEDFLIVPMLHKMARMIAKFAPETANGVFAKAMQFKMEAANRMIVKERLAMFLGPVSQLLFNEAVIGAAGKQGKTVDFDEWARFFQDATGTTRSYAFFRPMTTQEQQVMNQPDPKTMMEMAKAELEARTRKEMGMMKLMGERERIAAETQGSAESSAIEIMKLMQKDRADWGKIRAPKPDKKAA